MKKILLIATGGTIASVKSEKGLQPNISPEGLLEHLGDFRKKYEIDVNQSYNLDSTNIGPEHWMGIAEYVRDRYEEYDGFVITHGTDTMAYTAAALSYMIQNSNKPIVITGSQKSINHEDTDARTNLKDSIIYAADNGSTGVNIVFAGQVIAGTRAKKIRSKSFNAFSSIDFPTLAIIQDGKIIRYLPEIQNDNEVEFYDKINPNVFILKMTPGMDPSLLKVIFEKYDAIIVESFGVGGIPASVRDEFYRLCQESKDKMIIMATQVSHEGSDMTIYEVGNSIKESCNFLESYDMTLEAVLTKTMWILANYNEDREEKFYKKINFDTVWR